MTRTTLHRAPRRSRLRAGHPLLPAAAAAVTSRIARLRADADRGDVPGWVLVTLMTAGLVMALWAVAAPKLTEVFTSAIDSVAPR